MGRLFTRVLGALLALVVWLLKATWRVRLIGPDPRFDTPHVFCFWHGRQAGLLAHPRHRPLVGMVSLSQDGALQSRVLGHLGLTIVRGSSSRQGAGGYRALVGTLKDLAHRADAAFAVDGPRGPLGEVKKGALMAARELGGSIIPMTFHADREWVFTKAWDQFALPKPFARVEIVRGASIVVDAQNLDTARLELQSALERINSGT